MTNPLPNNDFTFKVNIDYAPNLNFNHIVTYISKNRINWCVSKDTIKLVNELDKVLGDNSKTSVLDLETTLYEYFKDKIESRYARTLEEIEKERNRLESLNLLFD